MGVRSAKYTELFVNVIVSIISFYCVQDSALLCRRTQVLKLLRF